METLAFYLSTMEKEFSRLDDDEARVTFVYEQLVKIRMELKTNKVKNIYVALQEKNEGNTFFMRKDYRNAILAYNKSIIRCPHGPDATLEILCITIANRSATYYELKEYEKVLKDISHVEEIGKYPDDLQHKLRLRKARTLEATGRLKESVDAYKSTLASISQSNLTEAQQQSKILHVNGKILVLEKLDEKLVEMPNFSSGIEFTGGSEYLAVINGVTFRKDDIHGRFAVARENIKQGTVILVEQAYVASTNREFWLDNCQYCCVSTDQPIPCPNCCNVVFCSTNCQRLAKTFHDIECPLLDTVHSVESKENGMLSLRIICQRPYSFFMSKRSRLQGYFKDNCRLEPIKNIPYRSDDYENIFFLCRNQGKTSQEKLLTLTFMATNFLRILKLGDYFPFQTNDKVLRPEEIYIGALILRNLQVISYNTHALFELRKGENPLFYEMKHNDGNKYLGAAVYPTLSLFNHSCDPNIARFNVDNKIVIRTVKPVKAGDILYDNYGPHYCRIPREIRQIYLLNHYCFECDCPPCLNNWPTFNEMKEAQLRIACETETCPYVFVVDLTCEYIPKDCPVCKRNLAIRDVILGCVVANEMLKEPEGLIHRGEVEQAIMKYFFVWELLHSFAKPPHPLMAVVEDRIHLCMIQLGNKRSEYHSN